MLSDVVVAHDYLTQRGGAERVALELARGLNARKIVTSVHVPDQTFPGFSQFEVTTSRRPLLQPFRRDPRRALPLLAGAWSGMPRVDADLLVCSSTGWAHATPTTPRTVKVVYCHNPARWLYQPEDYLTGAAPHVRAALGVLSPGLRRWDRKAAATADVYIANSSSVARRIQRVYGIDASIVHPPVMVDIDGPREPVPGLAPGFFLTVGRARGYKGTQTLVHAFADLPGQRLVVVGGRTPGRRPGGVSVLGRVPEAQLRWLYANARALISVSHEDFGLTPLEAGAFGTPALLLRAGGFLDSTAEGVSGLFIESDTVDSVRRAVRDFPEMWDRAAVAAHARTFAPDEFIRRIQGVAAQARESRARRDRARRDRALVVL